MFGRKKDSDYRPVFYPPTRPRPYGGNVLDDLLVWGVILVRVTTYFLLVYGAYHFIEKYW